MCAGTDCNTETLQISVAVDDAELGEKPFVGGSAQFFKRAKICRGKVAACTATGEHFYALSVGHIGEPPQGAGGILQFGDDD